MKNVQPEIACNISDNTSPSSWRRTTDCHISQQRTVSVSSWHSLCYPTGFYEVHGYHNMCGMYSALIDALVSIRQRNCLCRGFTLSVSNWHVQPDSSLLSHTRLMCVCWIVLMTFTMWRQWIIYILATCSGIDVRIWEQAKLDNPDPTRMIPVPIIGFDELHQRLRLQEQQTSLHQARLEVRASFVTVILSILFNTLTYFQKYFIDVIKYESQRTQQCIVNWTDITCM